MSLVSGLQTGVVTGLATGLGDGIWGGISVGTDGPSNVYIPESAADFTELGITAPTSLWLCQEASGNLSDSIAAVTLTANGTADYRQTVSGWTRKFVVFTETANERFSHAAGTYVWGSGTSYAALWYVNGISVTANRDLILLAGSTSKVRILSAGGVASLVLEAGTASGAYNYVDGAAHAFLFVYDANASTAKLYTDQETITGTFGASITSGIKGIGGSGTSPPVAGYTLGAVWHGSDAEGLDGDVLTALGW